MVEGVKGPLKEQGVEGTVMEQAGEGVDGPPGAQLGEGEANIEAEGLRGKRCDADEEAENGESGDGVEVKKAAGAKGLGAGLVEELTDRPHTELQEDSVNEPAAPLNSALLVS